MGQYPKKTRMKIRVYHLGRLTSKGRGIANRKKRRKNDRKCPGTLLRMWSGKKYGLMRRIHLEMLVGGGGVDQSVGWR